MSSEFIMSAYDQAMKESIEKDNEIKELKKRIEVLESANLDLSLIIEDLKIENNKTESKLRDTECDLKLAKNKIESIQCGFE